MHFFLIGFTFNYIIGIISKKSVNWDQIDSSGKNVQAGDYTASTSTGSLNANVTFAIS